MKVRILKTVITSQGKATSGQELELQDDFALDLLLAGYAEEVVEKKTDAKAEHREKRTKK